MRQFRIAALLGALVGVLSCRESAAPEPQALFGSLPVPRLLTCTPIAADSATETIGPEGGYLTVGRASLYVPPGALPAPVAIHARVPAGTRVSVVLQPEGLEFQQQAYLTLSYANCGLLFSLLPKRIAYTTDDLVILQLLLSWDNLFAQRVSAPLDHFSTYAVAW